VTPPGSEPPAFTVLIVCTGNVCRSAFAERLGRAYLREHLGARAEAIRLTSAGTRAVVGSAMHPDSANALRGFGADAGDFRARQLEDRMAAEADLILTMTRRHRRDVLHVAPRAMARTFTLREAAALLPTVGDRDIAGRDIAERARSFVTAMATARGSRRSGEDGDDVFDPIGLPPAAHQEMGEMVTEALLPVLDRLVRLCSHTSTDGD
jgi:protein-tyrosine-phosphatase